MPSRSTFLPFPSTCASYLLTCSALSQPWMMHLVRSAALVSEQTNISLLPSTWNKSTYKIIAAPLFNILSGCACVVTFSLPVTFSAAPCKDIANASTVCTRALAHMTKSNMSSANFQQWTTTIAKIWSRIGHFLTPIARHPCRTTPSMSGWWLTSWLVVTFPVCSK